jgi:hypothetical protein
MQSGTSPCVRLNQTISDIEEPGDYSAKFPSVTAPHPPRRTRHSASGRFLIVSSIFLIQEVEV